MMRRRSILTGLALALTTSIVPSASAVLIGPGDGTQNTTQPPGVPAWFNVGKISIGTGVYLGNQWVLTAFHLDPATNHNITFYPGDNFPNGGVTVGMDPNSVVRLKNPDNTNTDMALIRTTSDPGLPTLALPDATPIADTPITLTGFGVNRGTAVQYLVVGDSHAAVWTQVSSGGNYSGYQFDPNGVFTNAVSKRWGTNLTSNFPGGGPTTLANNPGNNSFTTVLGSSFDSPGTSSEAIGVSGDSGGAVFSSASPNTLLGLILYQDQGTVPADQPSGTAIYGNYTDAGDLATYSAQIEQVTGIPEPSSALVLAVGAGLFVRRRRP